MQKKYKITFFVILMSWIGHVETKPYVVGELYGLLGNQCFEVAATLAHAWDHQAEACFPAFKTKTTQDVPINYEKIFWRLNTKQPNPLGEFRYVEQHLHYAPIPFVPNMTIAGYFQSVKYFDKYRDRICDLFAPSTKILEYLKSNYSYIIDHPMSVGVHYRDYFKESSFYGYRHGVVSKEYYRKAFAHFPKEALFVVFSDNIKWCKDNLKDLAPNIVFIEKEADYHDFYLMSLCKHGIISNSTFSWWAAYLIRNPDKKVIAPDRWMKDMVNFNCKDVIPDEWIKVEI